MGKTVKFPGISEQVQGLLDANMDQVAARRRAREAFKDIQLSVDYCLFKVYIHTYILPHQLSYPPAFLKIYWWFELYFWLRS